MLGIGAEGIHVPALPLGIDRIEGQGGLSASAQPGNYYEFPTGDAHVHPLQVMGPGAVDLDIFFLFQAAETVMKYKNTKFGLRSEKIFQESVLKRAETDS